jgi:hypothetical protein
VLHLDVRTVPSLTGDTTSRHSEGATLLLLFVDVIDRRPWT